MDKEATLTSSRANTTSLKEMRTRTHLQTTGMSSVKESYWHTFTQSSSPSPALIYELNLGDCFPQEREKHIPTCLLKDLHTNTHMHNVINPSLPSMSRWNGVGKQIDVLVANRWSSEQWLWNNCRTHAAEWFIFFHLPPVICGTIAV